MELLAYLSYDTFAPFLGNMLTNILSNRADSGLKQLEALLAAKLQDGQLPAPLLTVIPHPLSRIGIHGDIAFAKQVEQRPVVGFEVRHDFGECR
jgi:hypothetical protein